MATLLSVIGLLFAGAGFRSGAARIMTGIPVGQRYPPPGRPAAARLFRAVSKLIIPVMGRDEGNP
ncbi:MAG: hypothetical protein ACOY33_06045 [Pseudomonadota bacterium]